MNSKKAIFVIGPPGAGKGTQAKFLVEKTGFYHFITSKEGKDYIAAHRDDPVTLRQEALYKQGVLFEPEWLIGVQKKRTEEILKENWPGILYDGSPRTLFEAENLPKFLSGAIGKENIVGVVVDVSVDEARKRAGERLVCSKDENHMVSTRLMPDAKEGQSCRKCDGVLRKRDLDAEVGERVKQYQERTAPGINFLKENYNVIVVNGEQSVENVHKDIMEKLEKFLA